jgi:hypothetical protein
MIPAILNKMASMAFDEPSDSSRQSMLKKAIRFEKWLFMFGSARKDAEKAIIYFPESNYYDFYLFTAASCAKRSGETDVAMHWYECFLERFPDHKWAPQVKTDLNKMKALDE